MRRVPILATLVVALLAAPGADAQTPDDPRRVLVLYDANEADLNGNGIGDSEEIARLYARVRGVPARNLLALNVSTASYYYSGTAAWTSLFDDVIAPLQAKLAELGPTTIDVLCLSHGLPYRLTIPGATSFAVRALDNIVAVPFSVGSRSGPTLPSFKWTNPYFESSPSRPPDLGRFLHATHTFGGKPLYLVSRLDGPSVHAARELIEGARYGERYLDPRPGYYNGFGYVDSRYGLYTPAVLNGYPFGYGSYQSADKCVAFGTRFVQSAGLALKWEPTGKEIGEPGAVYQDSSPATRAPRALFYGGWYNYRQYHDVWEWLPGSVACDLNSNSIQNFHTAYDKAFLTQAFARGLAAGAGVIAEPYLSGHYRPEVLLHYLLAGYTFAEAASLSNPALGWVCVQIGDPLYAPFRAGRLPIVDTTPPPAPALAVEPDGLGSARVVADLATLAGEPDLVTARVEYGTTEALGTAVDHDTVYRVRKTVTLTSLAADTLYHYRTKLRDPAGLETATPTYVFFSTPADPVRTHIAPTLVNVRAQGLFNLNLIFVCEPDLSRIESVSFQLTDEQTKTTYDVMPMAYFFATSVAASADYDTLALRLTVPAAAPPGTYTFRTTLGSGGKSHAATARVVIAHEYERDRMTQPTDKHDDQVPRRAALGHDTERRLENAAQERDRVDKSSDETPIAIQNVRIPDGLPAEGPSHILVVGASPAAREATVMLLQTDGGPGWEPDAVADAGQARAKLMLESFDLVVARLDAGPVDHRELFRAVHAARSWRATPVVVIHPPDDEALAAELTALGAFLLLPAPLDASALIEGVRRGLAAQPDEDPDPWWESQGSGPEPDDPRV